MTKIVTFRMTDVERIRMEEAAAMVGAQPPVFIRKAVVARTEEVLREEETEAETSPKTCGDLGGVTLTGKPCGRKVLEGRSRCSAHTEAEKG